jgi:hypothetical protein
LIPCLPVQYENSRRLVGVRHPVNGIDFHPENLLFRSVPE